LVRTVVGAEARADAALVDHVVEAVGAVDGGRRRADVFARRLFAVHAGQGLEVELARALGRSFDVAVYTQPMHLAAAADLIFADHRDVVLGLARDDTGAAAGASGEVDDHAPLVI